MHMYHSDWSNSYEINYFHDVLDLSGEIAEDETTHLLCGEQKIEVSNSGRPHNIDQRDGEDVHFSTQTMCLRRHDDGKRRTITKN